MTQPASLSDSKFLALALSRPLLELRVIDSAVWHFTGSLTRSEGYGSPSRVIAQAAAATRLSGSTGAAALEYCLLRL